MVIHNGQQPTNEGEGQMLLGIHLVPRERRAFESKGPTPLYMLLSAHSK